MARVGVLRQLNVPAPVVGGGVVAVILALADAFLELRLGFNLGLKDSLLLMFFTTVGFGADARLLMKGGPRLVIFLAIGMPAGVSDGIDADAEPTPSEFPYFAR